MAGPCSAQLQGEAAAFTAALRTLVNNPQFSPFPSMAHLGAPMEAGEHVPLAPGLPFPSVALHVHNVSCLQALEVLTSSVEYGLQDLCKLCIRFIKDTLSVEQVCEALQAAVTYGLADLQQHCLAFIEGCTAAVVRTQGFHELSDVVLARVLRSDRLAVDELDLVQAVREWAHVSSAVLERPVPEVAALPVRELRLPLLAPNELATLESHNQRDLLIPVESIAAAWRAHALRKGSGVPSHLCRPRRGTRPRDHHRHLDPHTK
ncbi:btb poz domain-containing protein 19 [Limosa lapponica baueri]|uniref:Btb poz domain-containing protein 19 n=1 Tax=Limosa lapponica baueri TaxID=1758121 RepID=A0A2I0UEV9_LIMLA|nr:btb poz domain-containing protein 19 [Limosa lapponica baueri]